VEAPTFFTSNSINRYFEIYNKKTSKKYKKIIIKSAQNFFILSMLLNASKQVSFIIEKSWYNLIFCRDIKLKASNFGDELAVKI
jgi:hypothetical protein